MELNAATVERCQRFTFAAEVTEAADGAREVSGLVVPWGVEVPRFWGMGVFQSATTRLPEDLSTVKLLVQHNDDRPVGYATSATYDDDGLRMSFTVPANHGRAADYLADLDEKLRDGFSVGIALDPDVMDDIMDALWGEKDDAVEMRGIVREVSAVSIPAFNDARANNRTEHIARFTAAQREAPKVTITAEELAARNVELLEQLAGQTASGAQLPTTAELAAEVAKILAAGAPDMHALSAFDTFADYQDAVRAGTAERFAIVNQITTNNAGVMPPAWLTEIVGILDQGRTFIGAMGGPKPITGTGLEMDWAYYDGDLRTLVGEQTTEKTEITSARVDLKKGSTSIKTYAGGSDISYQLIKRSSPAYREAYGRIMALAYAIVTDDAFGAAVLAGATAWATGGAAPTTAAGVRGLLVEASLKVKRATGLPARAVLVSDATFIAWSKLDGLFPAQYGTSNVSGTMDAATLKLNIAGLEVTPSEKLTGTNMIISNELAASWHEDGPFTAEAEDVFKLGHDVAIWGMGATRIAVPTGIVKPTFS